MVRSFDIIKSWQFPRVERGTLCWPIMAVFGDESLSHSIPAPRFFLPRAFHSSQFVPHQLKPSPFSPYFVYLTPHTLRIETAIEINLYAQTKNPRSNVQIQLELLNYTKLNKIKRKTILFAVCCCGIVEGDAQRQENFIQTD